MAMSTRVRLLPVLAAVALGTFAVKAVSMAEAAGEAAAKAEKNKAQESHDAEPETAIASEDDVKMPELVTEKEEQASENVCDVPDFLSEQTGLSQYEIQVLRSLADRREQLDTREATLDTREMTVSAAELRLNEQIDELKRLEASIDGLLNQLDQKNDEQLASLVKVYESMKSKDAARIFNTLNDELMLSLADRMKPAAMAAILSDMAPERARTLTQLMAQKTEPPRTVADLETRTNEP
jgi:flagellar motility protein MotE (MotC chaperone)